MQVGRVYTQIAEGLAQGARYIDSCGGTRSGKTFATLQTLIVAAARDTTPTLTSVTAESVPHLRRGAMRDFEQIMRCERLWKDGAWNATDHTYTFPNGSKIEFFSIENAAKVHGAARDLLFINEAQDIPYDTARQLFVRTRGTIFLDYNPTHEFWAHSKIRGSGKEYTIISTYRDNPFLSPAQVAEIESNRGDAAWWRVYGEGLTGHREGLVFPDWQIVDAVPPAARFRGRGVDFGFTNDPTAVVDVFTNDGALFLDERLYRRGLTNDAIAHFLLANAPRCDFVAAPVRVIADSAEQKSIAEIRALGVRGIEGAVKGAGSTNVGIDAMRRYPLRVTRGSVNLLNELRNYMWRTDKGTGEYLNVPIDKYNHALDAARYVVAATLLARRAAAPTEWTPLPII